MNTDAGSSPSSGALRGARDKTEDLVSSVQEQVSVKTRELGEDASFQLREQIEQRSTEAGKQVHSIGRMLQSGANQLRSEGNGVPAKVVEEMARRADDLGEYLQSAEAARMLDDVERFARRRPWLTAGAGVLAGVAVSRFVKASAERRYTGAQSNGRSSSSPAQQALSPGVST